MNYYYCDTTKKGLFVVDCADHVLKFFENVYPRDLRPKKAIEAARLFVAGKITVKQLKAAADAACNAADSAASTKVDSSTKSASHAALAASHAAYAIGCGSAKYANWSFNHAIWATKDEDSEKLYQNDLFLNYINL